MWRNVISDEGQRIVKRAERAQDAGDYGLARELYLRAISKFREASEISHDFKEIGILRSLVSYYSDRVGMLEKDLDDYTFSASRLGQKPEEKETPASDVIELLSGSAVPEQVFGTVLAIAIEISREGREGHTIGTGFLIGDAANVMAKSRQLVLN